MSTLFTPTSNSISFYSSQVNSKKLSILQKRSQGRIHQRVKTSENKIRTIVNSFNIKSPLSRQENDLGKTKTNLTQLSFNEGLLTNKSSKISEAASRDIRRKTSYLNANPFFNLSK